MDDFPKGAAVGAGITVGVAAVLFALACAFSGGGRGDDHSYAWWQSNCDLTGAKDNRPVYTCYGVPHTFSYAHPDYSEDAKRTPDGWITK